jgi:hypothetical protein
VDRQDTHPTDGVDATGTSDHTKASNLTTKTHDDDLGYNDYVEKSGPAHGQRTLKKLRLNDGDGVTPRRSGHSPSRTSHSLVLCCCPSICNLFHLEMNLDRSPRCLCSNYAESRSDESHRCSRIISLAVQSIQLYACTATTTSIHSLPIRSPSN